MFEWKYVLAVFMNGNMYLFFFLCLVSIGHASGLWVDVYIKSLP